MIEEDPRIDPAELRRARFPGSVRKFDAKAVQDFLASVADRVEATNALVDRLEADLAVAATASPQETPPERPSPFEPPDLTTISEDELVRIVGEETVHVLATARKAASDIRTKAEESAARLIRESTAEAARLVAEAEADVAAMTAEAAGARDVAVEAATAEAEEIRTQAAHDAEQVLTEAHEQAEALLASATDAQQEAAAERERIIEEAKDEGRAMLAEVKDVRSRILEDLQRRRDLGRSQIERLAAGRDQLLAAYAAVRENIDEITAKLEVGLLETASSGHDPLLDDGFAGIVMSDLRDVDHDEDDSGDGPAADATEPDGAEPDDPAEDGDDETDGDVDVETDGDVDVDVETDGDIDSEAAAESEADVDALFAKIRADRAQSVARAQQVLAGDDTEADDAGDAETPGAEDPAGESPSTDDAADDPSGSETDEAGSERVPAELLADEDARAHRAQVLDRLDKALTRALKRHLADEQNVVLDALRRSESTDLADLLPPAADHVAGYAAVASVQLGAAATAGAATVHAGVVVDVSALADELGAALVEPFRRRIERSATDVEGDADALDERLRALYREWKVEHIGALAGDALLSAFAHGQYAAAPAGSTLRWTIDPDQGPCPDAQDNALAGAVPKGEPFPTGDECPQAHPGCRCLLVVDA